MERPAATALANKSSRAFFSGSVCAAACAALFFAAVPTLAQSPSSAPEPLNLPASQPSLTADQLVDRGNLAKKEGALPDAAKWFCLAADADGRFAKRCDKAKHDLEDSLARFASDLEMGRMKLTRKDYGGAQRDLSKITFGPHLEEAQQLMEEVRIDSGQIPPELASAKALEDAEAAYAKGDLDGAEALAQRVRTPDTQPSANQILTNIRVYRQAMREADDFAANGDHKAAALKYAFAAMIQPQGPGLPQKHEQAEEAEGKASAVTAEGHGSEQTLASSEAPSDQKATEGQTGTVLSRAHARASRRKAKTASRRASQHNLAPKPAEAGDTPAPSVAEVHTEAAEPQLTRAIADLYASRFVEADRGLRAYLQSSDIKHAGPAHFFLGDSLLTQALLADPENGGKAEAMRQEGLKELFAAKQLGYHPVSAAVSPKVLEQWAGIGNTQ